jgi:hypothetical protein
VVKSAQTLHRFTNLAAAIHMLRTRRITLLDPNTWDDKNDAYFMAEYKRQKGLTTLLALCFADCDETYHHWRVFSHGADGVRIDFEKRALLSAFVGDNQVLHGDMRYRLIKDLRTPRDYAVDDLPFLKRYPFRDEKEFRIIFADRSVAALSKDYTFDLSAIRRITLSPWIVRDLADSIINTLRQIDGCKQLKIYRSTLIDNAEWKKFALALDHPKSEQT